jgi:hypothetical protein
MLTGKVSDDDESFKSETGKANFTPSGDKINTMQRRLISTPTKRPVTVVSSHYEIVNGIGKAKGNRSYSNATETQIE